MATTRLFLDTRRVKAGKPAILKIAISHKNSSALISLNIKLLPERQWDSIKSKVINHNDKLILNSYISQTKNAVDSIIIDLTRDGKIISMSASEIKTFCECMMNPEKKVNKEDKKSFLFRFRKYADRMKPGSRKIFDHTLNRLTAFVGEDKLKKLKFERTGLKLCLTTYCPFLLTSIK